MSLNNIEQVIDELDHIIQYCENQQSRQAYFAALYRAMTESVKKASRWVCLLMQKEWKNWISFLHRDILKPGIVTINYSLAV